MQNLERVMVKLKTEIAIWKGHGVDGFLSAAHVDVSHISFPTTYAFEGSMAPTNT